MFGRARYPGGVLHRERQRVAIAGGVDVRRLERATREDPGNTPEDAGNVRVLCPTAPVDTSNVPAAISHGSGA